jgi:hypothetical protein
VAAAARATTHVDGGVVDCAVGGLV